MTKRTAINRCTLGVLFFLTVACGQSKNEAVSDKAGGADAVSTSEDAGTRNVQTTTPTTSATEKRTITISGKSDEGKAVSVSLQLVGTQLSGTFSFDSIEATVTGVADGNTFRCWINTENGATSPWRGNFIATESGKGLNGTFIISDSAAQSVIKGTLGTV